MKKVLFILSILYISSNTIGKEIAIGKVIAFTNQDMYSTNNGYQLSYYQHIKLIRLGLSYKYTVCTKPFDDSYFSSESIICYPDNKRELISLSWAMDVLDKVNQHYI